ncbi:MmpS family transport accessory protein [Corynebacterium kalidii]
MSTPNGQQQPQQGQPNHNQMPPQGYIQAPQKKPWYKRAIIMVPLTLIALVILFAGGCMALVGTAVNEVDKDMNAEHTITYQISGDTTDANVTYSVGESNTTQENGVASGWSKEVTVTGFWGASLIATNSMNGGGTITCQILVNGDVINENTATGDYASASCSASSTDIKDATE